MNPTELQLVSDRLKRGLGGIAIMSFVVNLLLLTGPLFMVAIYDHVIPTKSVETLVGLIILALIAYALYGVADGFRARALARVAASFAEAVSTRVLDAVLRRPLARGPQPDPLRPIRDLDEIRGYIGGPGAAALFDVPWIPIYVGVCFAFHFWIGVAVVVGALVLIVVTLIAELMTRGLAKQAGETAGRRGAVVEAATHNLEVLMSMGMLTRILARWTDATNRTIASSLAVSDRAGAFQQFSRVFRMALQSAVLALGALLVIEGQASAGVIIASSILSSRALAPVDQVIATWRSQQAARQGWSRIGALLEDVRPLPPVLALPPPQSALSVEDVSLVPPGSNRQTLIDISFEVEAGSAVAVLGPSGSGKSSLVRTLVGIWKPTSGAVRVDASDVSTWSLDYRRRHIGYLPQDVELIEGTVAENIARFDDAAPSNSIIAAANEAQVHELIVRLPNGYETVVGPGGSLLSAGQKQRIALARALYGNPFLVVLDEPNSNLDSEGDAALSQSIQRVRQRGGIVVIVAHRESAIAACDRIAFLQGGMLRAYGPKEQVMRPRVSRIDIHQQRQPGLVPKGENAS